MNENLTQSKNEVESNSSIIECLKNLNPSLAKNIRIEISADDLITFLSIIESRVKGELESKYPGPDELMSSKQIVKEFNITEVTLWHYDKKQITHPVRTGQRKMYYRSEMESLLSKRI